MLLQYAHKFGITPCQCYVSVLVMASNFHSLKGWNIMKCYAKKPYLNIYGLMTCTDSHNKTNSVVTRFFLLN
jgi:hypothetical protein